MFLEPFLIIPDSMGQINCKLFGRYYMKLIDEKGRLFGKINLIDLLVVLLIVVQKIAGLFELVKSLFRF